MHEIEIPNGDASRVKVSEKAILGGMSDVNQLVPFKHRWAWDMYLKATEGQWMPAEVEMLTDIANKDSSQAFRLLLTTLLERWLSFSYLDQESVAVGVYRQTTSPECRQFLLAANFAGTVRDNALNHIADSLGLNIKPWYDQYARDTDAQSRCLRDPTFSTLSPEDSTTFLKAVITNLVRRHVLFGYKEFSDVYMHPAAKLYPGTMEILRRIVTIEMRMAEFYANLIVTCAQVETTLWSPELETFIRETVQQAEAHNGFHGGLLLSNWIFRKLNMATKETSAMQMVLKEVYGLNELVETKQTIAEQSGGGLDWD